MRRIATVLAVASLALVQPAHAAPAIHHIHFAGSVDLVSVTCDTSSYPAASYPCAFSMDVSADVGAVCGETASDGHRGNCSVSLTGTVLAVASLAPNGRCSFAQLGSLTLTVRSGVDPGFEFVNRQVPFVLQSVEAYYGGTGTRTQTRLNVVLPGDGGPGGLTLAVPLISAGFGFTDIEGDCRTRAGGDPTSDNAGTLSVGPFGEIVIVRTA